MMNIDGVWGITYNLPLAAAMRAMGEPRLFFYHSTSYLRRMSRLMWFLLKIVGKATLRVARTQRMLSRLGAIYGTQARVLAVINAAWVALPLVWIGSGSSVLRLGILSGLTVEKEPPRAVETLCELRHRGVVAELVFAGAVQDDMTQLLLGASRDEFGAAVQYAGIVAGEAWAAFYVSLDYFLFPSLYRHGRQSLVLPEALASGTPVKAFDHAFVGEIVGNGGHLIPTDKDCAPSAADWIVAADAAERLLAAGRQVDTLKAQARGQIDKMIDWAHGTAS